MLVNDVNDVNVCVCISVVSYTTCHDAPYTLTT